MTPWAILEAPSILGLAPTGVEHLAATLLDAGLAARLGARRAGRVTPPPYDPRRDPDSGVLNPHGLRRFSADLADAVGAILDGGELPLVLGGDCSNLLGCMLALRRRGRHGLLFIDGHADFYQPSAEPKGEVASMDLALATGHGPLILADLERRGPLVREEDVVLYARRDAEDAAAHGSQRVEETAIHMMDLAAVRRAGAPAAAAAATSRLAARGDFFVHVDCDCLDDAVMPAVDYRMPDGLSFDELALTLRTALATGRVAGVEVTVFNPSLDAGGTIARALVDCLVAGLGD
jgi:arginase